MESGEGVGVEVGQLRGGRQEGVGVEVGQLRCGRQEGVGVDGSAEVWKTGRGGG